jgi:phosphoribosyl 1,2-cyclic phosphodiesterase
MEEFKIKFRGVRGSIPVPGKSTIKYGGNTTCIEVKINGNTIIIDAGTGIINLGNEMVSSFMKQDEETKKNNPMTSLMLFTHAHLDHVMGLPFFVPAYIGSSKLYMFGNRYYERDFKESLSQVMHTPLFPVEFDDLQSMRDIRNIQEGQMIVIKNGTKEPLIQDVFRPTIETNDDDIKIYIHQSYSHPSDGVLVFKFQYKGKSLVFATDVEGYKVPDARLVKFAKDVDVLIHDAQYTEQEYVMSQGYGHSTIEMAIDVAKASNVKKLYLFHHDPKHNDQKMDELHEYAKTLLPNVYMSIEDEEIDLLN